MKKVILFTLFVILLMVSVSAQVTQNLKRNGFTPSEMLMNLEDIKKQNPEIVNIERIGDDNSHFIFIAIDENEDMVDLLIYNYQHSNRKHNGILTGERVYWNARSLDITYPKDGLYRKLTNVVTSGSGGNVSYALTMSDGSVITIKYNKSVDRSICWFRDNTTNSFSELYIGYYIEDGEISSN